LNQLVSGWYGSAQRRMVFVEQFRRSGPLLRNAPLEKAMHDNLLRLGPPPFDGADRDFARKSLLAPNSRSTRGGNK